MKRTPPAPAGAGGDDVLGRATCRQICPAATDKQAASPIEVHDPIPDDKLVLFHIVTPRMLARLAERFRRCPVRGAAP
jgi:hypothetical protein